MMFDLYFTEPYVPFTMSLALLFGLLILELVLALLGGTLLGMGADADLDVDLDIDAPDLGDLDIDLGDADPEVFDFAEPEVDADMGAATVGPASWLGIGKMPALIWVAAVLLAFGISGLVIQGIAGATLAPLPALMAALPAGAAALWFARTFGAAFARLLPKTESTAMSNRHLGRRMGVVTQGTARRGAPTEVRVTDRHGNTHYIRAEPLKDEDAIVAGTQVLILRHKLNEGYRIVPLGPEN